MLACLIQRQLAEPHVTDRDKTYGIWETVAGHTESKLTSQTNAILLIDRVNEYLDQRSLRCGDVECRATRLKSPVGFKLPVYQLSNDVTS